MLASVRLIRSVSKTFPAWLSVSSANEGIFEAHFSVEKTVVLETL
jgi:hypothetical protein